MEKAYWLNLMALLFTLVSLCGSFSDDDVYKTRPLLTSSVHGRLPLTLARLAAGVSLACGGVLVLFGLTAAIQFFVHGGKRSPDAHPAAGAGRGMDRGPGLCFSPAAAG